MDVHKPTRRRQGVLPVFASFAALAFVLVSVTSPIAQQEAAAAVVLAEAETMPTQVLAVDGEYTTDVVRDGYGVTGKPLPPPPPPTPTPAAASAGSVGAPAAGVPDPGSAKAIAYAMVQARGWGEGEYNCLVSLWQKESGWNTFASNPSSGAYGIPQSLPGSKMATAGADWATNPATQITWGLGYITARYASPCGAWGASQVKGWY
ncbi:MAG: transglycosylase SLT domain-containing protein [Microbacteriaceae bacterium]|nr:transglycosylase SLT domain-containing protein [Microbacteriaceae bacterium]